MIPTDGRNKGAKSKPNAVSNEIDKDKRIQELVDENRQLKLQISALKNELERIQQARAHWKHMCFILPILLLPKASLPSYVGICGKNHFHYPQLENTLNLHYSQTEFHASCEINNTPRVPGPQWEEITPPALVTKISFMWEVLVANFSHSRHIFISYSIGSKERKMR